MKKVLVKCKGAAFAPLDEFVWFQGELKTLSDEAYKKLKHQILELGFSEPLSIWINGNDLTLINGHQRVLTLKRMRDEGHEIPYIPYSIVEAENYEEAKRKVLSLASNFGKITEQGLVEFVSDTTITLEELKDEFMLTDIKIEDLPELREIEVNSHTRMIGGEKEEIEDDVPEIEEDKEPTTKLGDVWLLGKHRLMCGDSTNEIDVENLMNGEMADMVLTDPPYGVSIVKSNMVGADFGVAKKGKYKKVIGDETTNTAKRFYENCKVIGFKNFIIWGGNYFTDFLEPKNSWVVWNKRGDTGIENTFADGELAWSNIGFPVRIHHQLWNGMIRAGEKEKRVHPTQKPIALAEFCFDLIKNCNSVFDGFGGSGSTLIACEKTLRKCFMMEFDPFYCDVIIARWEKYTGQTAILESSLSKLKKKANGTK